MKYLMRLFNVCIIFIVANITNIALEYKWLTGTIALIFFILLNIMPTLRHRKLPKRRYRICANGCELLIDFLISTTFSIVYLLLLIGNIGVSAWFLHAFFVFLCESIVFWNGIIRVYITSFQIGMKWRVIGAICGMIPILNLWALYKIITIAYRETMFESEKIWLNESRIHDCLCATRYPLLLVHGVFFRDYKYFNYWGRIPKELEQNGATIYYGNHESAASVIDSAKELGERILQIRKETNCEKVNIIAHSKGGLDTRYAISVLGMDTYVASLTTINTPHRGCVFADYLLHKLPDIMIKKTADSYNFALRKVGDKNPNFISAVHDLTATSCEKFNALTPNKDGVYYQSVGSKLDHAGDGRFPLNFSTKLVKYFDGPNDGLVSENSFPWGEHYQFLTTKGKRGISHGDMIDLNRENINDFDVREFYVQLVHDLKERGL